jgi:prepilin-type N-terminal cleavage/methylation domain-containing protein
MPSREEYQGREGFTLVEVLAALAIGSVIIVSTAALTWNVAFYFDRGTRGVSRGDRLILVAERLASDFGSARYLLQSSAIGVVSTFTGTAAKILFVTLAAVVPTSSGEEIVSLAVENGEAGTTRLVRRRAVWLDPRTPIETIVLQDDVTLIEGKFDIAFAFGRYQPDGLLTWRDSWIAEATLPRLVRVILRERDGGLDLFRGVAFPIRADAPPACAKPDAKISCLSVAASAQTTPTMPFGNLQ